MAFKEKSAWLMALALAAMGALYAWVVAGQSMNAGALPPPPSVIGFTVGLVALVALGHIAISALTPKDAAASADERDRTIAAQARAWSGHVISAGLVLALGRYLLVPEGDALFYTVFAVLLVGHLSDYVLQIVLYRRGA